MYRADDPALSRYEKHLQHAADERLNDGNDDQQVAIPQKNNHHP